MDGTGDAGAMRRRIEQALRAGPTPQGVALVEALVQDRLKALREPVTVVLCVDRDGTDVYAASRDVSVVRVDTPYYRENNECIGADELEELLAGRLVAGDPIKVAHAVASIRKDLADYVEENGPGL